MVEQFLDAGHREKAFELLFKLALFHAKKKNFRKSEAFRDRLYEVDSLALSRIVEVNEVIDAEKSKAITPDHHRLWPRFFKELSSKEANALFLSLKKQIWESETVVLHQGRTNDKLFFVFRGELKLLYSDPNKEFLIKKLGSGDYFGEDTFFSVNVCTAMVKTLTQVHVGIIDREVFNKLKTEHRSLDSSLKKICGNGSSIVSHLRQKGIDRRSDRRINFNTKVSFQLLASETDQGMPRSATAELWDISKGGLSFYFQSKNPEAVRNLIGRNVGVRFNLDVNGKSKNIALTGVVHGVQSHPLEEYSVHLQFHRKLSDTAIKTIRHIAEGR